MRGRLFLVSGSILAALLIAEGTVRIVNPLQKLEFIADNEVYWRYEPNQYNPGPPEETINGQGFRDASDLGPKDSRQRILILGDSYAWGAGVSDDETMSEQLERLSDGRLEAINAAMPGWGIFQMEAMLIRWIEHVDPDVIVVVFPVGDIYRQPFETDAEKEAYLRESRIRHLIRDYSKLATVFIRAIEKIRLASTRRPVRNAHPMPVQQSEIPPREFVTLWERDKIRLINMKRMADNRNTKFLILAWPQPGATSEWFMREIVRFSDELGVPPIDFSIVLSQYHWDEYTLPGDHHPSALGQRLAAEEVFKYLK